MSDGNIIVPTNTDNTGVFNVSMATMTSSCPRCNDVTTTFSVNDGQGFDKGESETQLRFISLSLLLRIAVLMCSCKINGTESRDDVPFNTQKLLNIIEF